MIELYLDECMREQLLNYDYEHSGMDYDTMMYYAQNTESQILYDIIFGLIYDEENILEKFGFSRNDIDIMEESDVNIYFTNKQNYYIKEVNDYVGF